MLRWLTAFIIYVMRNLTWHKDQFLIRGLTNILRLHVKKVNCSEWEQITVPSSVRAIVALNLHNYGSGRHPWGNLKPDYLEKKKFVEAHADDGLLEIFGLKHGWHASFVMVELISAKHISQVY
ncbi:diacylglycerol kinase 3-like isoform X2 [Humulus lupulus]|uniref:diacylglycerol kinase 3-like isoform X2 n=1 Tax=Humulus lupulus TaxID=3486 RepID=UPI002B407797|nr:diacylglycerol kinase 3-like isoform X2 [Humulus lupulus]